MVHRSNWRSRETETVGNSRKQSGAARRDHAKIVNPPFFCKKTFRAIPFFFESATGNSWKQLGLVPLTRQKTSYLKPFKVHFLYKLVACHPRPIHWGFNGIAMLKPPGKARRYCAEQKELLRQGAHDAFVSSRICTLPATQGKHLSTAKDAILLTCLACLPLFMNAGPCWAQIPVLP